MPKQFVKLFGDRSLFQEAVLRNRPLCDRTIVAANIDQIHLAETQLKSMCIDRIEGLAEPIGRNTAPAIALALMSLPPDEIVLITPFGSQDDKTSKTTVRLFAGFRARPEGN
jgi:mannose-1-phosphate guanylyltransferase